MKPLPNSSPSWRRCERTRLGEYELSKSRLAVVLGHSHYNFLTSTEVPRIVDRFLRIR